MLLTLVAFLGASAVLLYYARQFHFTCDDAFITLRYARNLATIGAPVYNPGERVEGYTNFLWMLLAAGGIKLGIDAVVVLKILGGLSGVATLAAGATLFERVEPRRPFGTAFVLAALALSAPLAAWTFGGLETPLFAALVTLGCALAADVAGGSGWRRAMSAGAVLALATLTRPEGALVFGIAFVVIGAHVVREPKGRLALIALAAAYLAIVVPFVAWRWHYYGYPLPNTYYLKMSGGRIALFRRGSAYIWLAARELGLWLIAAVAVAICTPDRRARDDEPASLRRTRSAVLWIARILLPTFVVYVTSVGGDFLDLYRFFVPLLPLAFVAIAAAGYALREKWIARPRSAMVLSAVAVAFVLLHGWREGRIASRALIVDEPARVAQGIAPLGWTRLYALRWAAMGRWLGRHGESSEWMAAGAAGALAFYSRMNNLDTLGLCDAFVAHQGDAIGDRPGHQRFAPHEYIVSKHPVFVLMGDQIVSDEPGHIDRDQQWDGDGYEWVEVRIGSRDGAPDDFYHRLLVRRDRLDRIRGEPGVRTRE
jgi:hypothetical protein